MRINLQSFRLVGVLLAGVSPLTLRSSDSDSACNNSPSLCDRAYNNITYMGAHDSAFLRDKSTGNSLSGNQYFNATLALDAGIRFLQAQVHVFAGELRLCHSSCALLDAGLLQDWLQKIGIWMDQHPRDVVTILLVNADAASVDEYATAFATAGISKYGFVPSSNSATDTWPTLQTMIDDDKRMVSLVTKINASDSYPYLLPEFNYVFETAFDVTELSGFNCTIDRPTNIGSSAVAVNKGYLSLVNHFKYEGVIGDIDMPDVENLKTVNEPGTEEEGNAGKHLQRCYNEWRRLPNLVLVDFWNIKRPIKAADVLNGLTDIVGRIEQTSAGVAARPMGMAAMVSFVTAMLLFA